MKGGDNMNGTRRRNLRRALARLKDFRLRVRKDGREFLSDLKNRRKEDKAETSV
jgi:hypothetical protein